MDVDNININLNEYIPNINVNVHTIKYILLNLMILIIICVVLFIISSYFFIKLLNIEIDDCNILFYDYNKKTKKILQLFGDYDIKNIYLTRQPFGNSVTFVLNILSMYKYDKLISDKKNSYLRHNGIIFEIQLPNNQTKLFYLEKNNSINICEKFVIHDNQELIKLKLNKEKYTMNSILDKTQERIGKTNFFNWHIYKNNCKVFIKEILKTLKKYNKTNKNFISYEVDINSFVNVVIPTEFTKHMINSFVNIFNIMETYYNYHMLN